MVCFMPDGRLKTESATLDPGPALSSAEAFGALSPGTRVLFHSYPHSEDITSDEPRVRALLETVELSPDLEGHSARLYSGKGERVLVVDHWH